VIDFDYEHEHDYEHELMNLYDTFQIGCGCMHFGGRWNEAPLDDNAQRTASTAVEAALAAGITLFDHADIYCRGKSEETFKAIFAESADLRDRIFLQSKCGIRFPDAPPGSPGRYDFSYDHIVSSVDGSLSRLGTDRLDMLLLHRPDPLLEPDEVARAFDDLHAAGKVLGFGVSNHTPAQMALLQKSLNQQLQVNQMEFSLLHTDMIDAGIASDGLEPTPSGAEGTIEYCRMRDIRIQAWSPLASGVLDGRAAQKGQNPGRVAAVQKRLQEYAEAKGCTMGAVALAWILFHPAGIQPVIGTRRPERIREACAAADVSMTREEWYWLYIDGRGEYLP
jgi:predicted oxidoreductase